MPPLVDRSNNKILPANSRAADVAEKGIREIIPVQQARYYNAFRPQGISCILYNHFSAGRSCTCNSTAKQLNTRLDKEGKASPGTINELMTGMTFTIDPYGVGSEKARPQDGMTSPNAPVNKYQGVFDLATKDEEFSFAHVEQGSPESFGDNGPVQEFDIDQLIGDLDVGALGLMDAACAVCFGTGFVGGYSTFHGHRTVLTCVDVALRDGTLDPQVQPWVARSNTEFEVATILPKGAIGVDSFRLLNGLKTLAAQIYIDGNLVRGILDILARCDGQIHKLIFKLPVPSTWTHLELQFNLTTESTYFEFPKLSKSSDTALLESTEPFQIILSPNVPQVETRDIITESMLGKTLIVQNANGWNSRNRNVLGWECQVRVLQPQEIYRILPHRGRVMLKDQTTNKVRDNISGPHRT